MQTTKTAKFLIRAIITAIIIFGVVIVYTNAELIREGKPVMDSNDSKKKGLNKVLTKDQYYVTIDNGTEPPFRNAYWDNKEEGIYVDVISGEPLFISKTKFNSGTGWPSFTKPIDKDNIIEKNDRTLGMARTEVRSTKSNAHLGHVFNDGPAPTGKRYCINSAALRFIPVDKMDQEGYTKYIDLFNEDGKKPPKSKGRKEQATFAAGCFWGVEAAYQSVPGVLSTSVGYTGGNLKNPTYEDVCFKNTNHAEVIQIEYDPDQITYEQLLNIFWKIHNPTTLNRQGPDIGTQYRSAIFYHNDKQKQTALNSKKKQNNTDKFNGRIVTEIAKASDFYRAEEYHQKYLNKQGKGTCKL